MAHGTGNDNPYTRGMAEFGICDINHSKAELPQRRRTARRPDRSRGSAIRSNPATKKVPPLLAAAGDLPVARRDEIGPQQHAAGRVTRREKFDMRIVETRPIGADVRVLLQPGPGP